MTARPAAVLWDMDGTLVDTEPYWFQAERDLVESYGHDWPDHHAHALIGFDLIESAEYIREHGHVPLDPADIVERMMTGVIEQIDRDTIWRPGARRLLAALNEAGIPCVLVTMSWRRLVEPVLAALPPDTFQAVIVGDEVPAGRGKPHPDPYIMGAAAVGVNPIDCVAIEDSPTGVRSALGAGCRVLGVPNIKALTPESRMTLVDSLRGIEILDLERLFVTRSDRTFRRRRTLVLGGLVLCATTAIGAAAVLGRDDEPQLPPGAVAIDAWAPYWALSDSLPEASARLRSVREVSPFWFGAVSATEIVTSDALPAETEKFFREARDAHVSIVPSITDDMPAGAMAAVLANPKTRSEHVAAIVRFASDLDVDGIDLDYEQFGFADGESSWETTRPNWVTFVDALAARLHRDGRTLTVSIPPVFDAEVTGRRGYWVYDHAAIAEFVDSVRILAYDYSTVGSEPGPIAPLEWVNEVVAGVSSVVPQEYHFKLVLGVPSYGANWVVSTRGTCPPSAEGFTNVTARTVSELALKRGGVPRFDGVTGEWSFTYDLQVTEGAVSCTQSRRVQWVDAEGVAARASIGRAARWGGVSLWALGYEDEAVWRALVAAAHNPIAS